MLQHVTLETTAAQAGRFGELLTAIGFEPVAVPESLGDGYRWFAAAGTQVHLALTESPTVPPVGHAAFVIAPLAPVADRLRGLGFEVTERRRHWGSARISVVAPGGHRIELMEVAPP